MGGPSDHARAELAVDPVRGRRGRAGRGAAGRGAAADPELRYTPTGKQIVEFTVLVSERRPNPTTGAWEDTEPTRHRVKAFKQLGDNIAESLGQGDRVIVHGTVTTDAWTDKDTGQKRTAQNVLADVVGPSLRWATTRITKTTRVTTDDTDRAPTDDA